MMPAFQRRDLGLLMIEKLKGIVAAGSLHHAYDGVNDWLYDFWPDLTWDRLGTLRDIDTILAHPDYPSIQSFFEQRYCFDLRFELEENRAHLIAGVTPMLDGTFEISDPPLTEV